ncbi:MAG TPA: hypothetical protein VJT74_07450 [Pyrinomonadaceae bacterium]|nr:hypothetical protein [Pyrinomonadaceae bacterium]
MSRDVALVIGVADASPLKYLSGAVNGARLFHDWASKVGYEAQLLVDEDDPVTIPQLRHELEEILKPEKGPIHRMVIYYAGHGLIREAEEGLWLLSDWHSELRAVGIEALKRRLYWHNVEQVAIFSDSCRSLPPDIDAADLTADAVLGKGPNRERKMPPIDKFIAAQDGIAAFMVPGANPEDDRCVFSGVLMEGLWGMNPKAFSKLLKDKVTSRSLGRYLDEEVPERAKYYQRKLVPQNSPTFPEDDDVYFYSGSGTPPQPPTLPPWPPPGSVIGMGPRHDDHPSPVIELGGGRVVLTGGAESTHVETVLLRDVEIIVPTSTRTSSLEPSNLLIEKIRTQSRPQAFETRAGFAVDGGTVKGIWTTADVLAESHRQPNWWRLYDRGRGMLSNSAPVLIEFEDGMFAAAAALPNFIGTIIRDARGISALIYRLVYEPPDSADLAEAAIAWMESGALRADVATDLAVRLRKYKHSDPVLGVISAYLYDSIGDIESIRRMAFYYTQHNQPIPYDIALLAQLRGELRDGLLRARVPAISEREPRTEAERRHEWTHTATPESEGEVGGLWPWMRQGWPFLDDPAADGSTLVMPGLIELSSHLGPGRFTTLDAEGGRELAKIFELAIRKQR